MQKNVKTYTRLVSMRERESVCVCVRVCECVYDEDTDVYWIFHGDDPRTEDSEREIERERARRSHTSQTNTHREEPESRWNVESATA